MCNPRAMEKATNRAEAAQCIPRRQGGRGNKTSSPSLSAHDARTLKEGGTGVSDRQGSVSSIYVNTRTRMACPVGRQGVWWDAVTPSMWLTDGQVRKGAVMIRDEMATGLGGTDWRPWSSQRLPDCVAKKEKERQRRPNRLHGEFQRGGRISRKPQWQGRGSSSLPTLPTGWNHANGQWLMESSPSKGQYYFLFVAIGWMVSAWGSTSF